MKFLHQLGSPTFQSLSKNLYWDSGLQSTDFCAQVLSFSKVCHNPISLLLPIYAYSFYICLFMYLCMYICMYWLWIFMVMWSSYLMWYVWVCRSNFGSDLDFLLFFGLWSGFICYRVICFCIYKRVINSVLDCCKDERGCFGGYCCHNWQSFARLG